MTDEEETLHKAREIVAAKQPGNRKTILLGSWDSGALVRDAIAELIRHRQEVSEE